MSLYSSIGKRLLDLVLVTLSAPVWLPLLAVVALIVKVGSGSPVFFRQMRPGREGRLFELVKFRTMSVDSPILPSAQADGTRLSRLGIALRRTSLDELPELLHVLRGEMSLVGPRPLLPQYLDRYTPEQARRHEVRPGITGWAQVNGRNALTWEEKFALDVWYVDNISLATDLRILWTTIWKTITGEGLSAEGHATMPEFMGSHDD